MSEPAPFARRLIRLRGSRQVELSPVEKGGDPEAIAGENIVLGADKETQDIGPPRASSLYSDCMRMRVLGVQNGKTMTRWGGLRNRLTFGIGNAIHTWVQNDPAIFGDRRRGWWRCTACLQIRYFGGPPRKRCENCGANARATVYHEHRMRIRTPLIVDGHVDMFFEKSAGIFRPVELKSMSGDLFEKLKAPIVKDEWQLLTYLWGGAIDKNLPVKLDNVGYIVYFAKKEFRASLPVKMFVIRKQPNIVAVIKEKLQAYKDGMEGYPKVLPKPHDTCIRHGGSGQERSCPTRGLCSSFWKDGI